MAATRPVFISNIHYEMLISTRRKAKRYPLAALNRQGVSLMEATDTLYRSCLRLEPLLAGRVLRYLAVLPGILLH